MLLQWGDADSPYRVGNAGIDDSRFHVLLRLA